MWMDRGEEMKEEREEKSAKINEARDDREREESKRATGTGEKVDLPQHVRLTAGSDLFARLHGQLVYAKRKQ